jgi:hypothetical protein
VQEPGVRGQPVPWTPTATCRVCGRLVAEGSAWRDDDDQRWNAHWDCHLRERNQRQAGLTGSERSIRGRLGAYTRWANTADRYMATKPARDGFLAKFEREVDPNNELTPQERHKRAEYARKAHMQRMALKSAQARRRRRTNGD